MDQMDELFEILSSLSDTIPTVEGVPKNAPGSTNKKGSKKQKAKVNKNKKGLKQDISNEIMLQALRDKGMLKEGAEVDDLL